jgi:hypothetical protein
MSTMLMKKMRPYSSLFLRPIASKLQVEVEGYKLSPNFEINTYGVSGTIQLKKKKHQKHEKQDLNNFSATNLMDPSLDAHN